MADFELPCYDDDHSNMFQRNDSVTDLHAYYMSQFNLELENNNKTKAKPDSFKYGLEESFDFEALDSWNTGSDKSSRVTPDYEVIDGIITNNINEQSIKEVLLDLDSIDFESTEIFGDQNNDSQITPNYQKSNEYIDDESLIDELCREDGETPRLSPDAFDNGYAQPKETNPLPPIETAFSKRYYNYSTNDIQQTNEQVKPIQTTPVINSIEYYSYPNNILYNLDNNKKYTLPDTPTSCTEFNFNRSERKVSVCESIESDVQSSCYYDENSENLDEDELFVNLDEFGIHFEEDGVNVTERNRSVNKVQRADKEKSQGEKACLWEHCYEKYPNQNTLVEHIERMHVNTYKGDEFSCLWKDCARARRPFNARYKLLIHMRVHSGHKPNRCHHPGCGKAFSRLENLKIHVRSHTGERPYACPAPHCRKAFSNSSDRAKHQRTHFNARPYACGATGCGKRYTDPSSLRKHVKSHPHIPNVPRTCNPPSRVMRRPDHEQLVPSSPAKLTTLRCIRDKLTVPRLHRI